jgi:tetratricopeptide (TPR) repeat protein
MIRLYYKSRFRRWSAFACALTTVGVGLSVAARADETKDHFDKGVSLYKEKKNEAALQEFNAARQSYMAVHKDGPEDANILFWIGFIDLQMQNYKDAVDPLEQAIQINPKSPEAHLNLGNVYDGLKRYDDAVREFKKVIELQPANLAPAKMADPWYNLGSVYYKQRKWPEAIAAYQKSAALNPKDPYVMDGLGYVLLETGDTRGAISAYEKATHLQSDNASFQFNLGLAWLSQAKKAVTKAAADNARTNALVPLGRAVELAPTNVQNRETLGETLYDLGRDNEALIQFDKAAQLDPKQYTPVYNMGVSYSRSNQQPKAIEAFRKALEIKPDDRDALHGLALSQSKAGQFDEAAASYKHLTELTPDDLTAWINLAYCLRSKGDKEGEVNVLEEALKHGNDPVKTAMVRRSLASYYYKKGDDDSLKRSQDEFERSLKDAPDNPEALNGLGLLMSKQKKYDDAIRYFKQAVAVRPNFDDAYNNLGVVYEAKKDLIDAKASYRKALLINPKNALAQKNIDRFDKPAAPAPPKN